MLALLRKHLSNLAVDVDLYCRLALWCGHHLEGPVGHVALHGLVVEAAANEPLGVVDRVLRVERRLYLGRVAHEPLGAAERDVRRRDAVPLVVRKNLNRAVLPHAHTRVCIVQEENILVKQCAVLKRRAFADDELDSAVSVSLCCSALLISNAMHLCDTCSKLYLGCTHM
eukprot:1334648-Pleurochrysis_carterae.AAC.2